MSNMMRPAATAASSAVPALLWATTVTGTLFTVWKNASEKTRLEEKSPPNKHSKLNVDLMDKIATKPYLPQTKKRSVPKRLRILSIDVPEMRTEGTDGECRISLSRIYSDGVAPPKKIQEENLEVIQKSLARSLVKCRHKESLRIGVEILESSVADLNPHNLRRTHQFGSYKYDPGKWARENNKKEEESIQQQEGGGDVQQASSSSAENDSLVQSNATKDDDASDSVTKTRGKKDAKDGGGAVLASAKDELDAPWNQYAWIQELQLRIGGKVQFAAPMEPASRWNRLLFGSVYKTTISSCRKPWEYLLLPIFHRNPAGTDAAGNKNWASNKPHAVIANGAAMQRVPGSLRFLQKQCQEQHVPLYIIHDPRVWGGNTHQGLPQAIHDMRTTIKYNIVMQAMQGSSAFQRGRMLGQVETEARWQAKDMGRRTREAVKEANEKLKRERENDWSKLSVETLQAKLVERGVISLQEEEQQPSAVLPTYTNGMIKLSLQCLAHEEQRLREADEEQDENVVELNENAESTSS